MYKLNDIQIKQLAEFTSNLSLVFFTTIVTQVFSGVDRVNVINVVLGLVISITCLIESLLLLKGSKK